MPEALLIFAYLCLFLWLIRVIPFLRHSQIPSSWLTGAFLLKILAGTALWAIYSFYYPDRSTADIFKYFDDGWIMFSALTHQPLDYLKMLSGINNDTPELTEGYYMIMDHWFREWETSFYNDTHTIIRWNAFVMLFSGGIFHVHTLFMSFFSLVGCVGLFRAFRQSISHCSKLLFAACFLLPSMLLWSSAPTKEGLLITGLGLFLYAFVRLAKGKFHFPWLVLLILSATLVFFQKFYVLASMLPALLIALWQWRSSRPNWILKTSLILTLAVTAVLLLEWLGPGYELMGRMAKKQQDFINHAVATGSSSMIPLMELDGSVWGFVKSIPHALGTTLLGPGYYWKGGILGAFANLENLSILGLFTLSLVFRKTGLSRVTPMLILSGGFILVLFILIGWTTPVLGALVRYRLPALPFLMALSLILVDREKLSERFPSIRKFLT